MVYKALNTFIDDLFAFVIDMPTLHRISCFRDDIIFVIYCYQRWIYPEKLDRANEFGQVGVDPETNHVKDENDLNLSTNNNQEIEKSEQQENKATKTEKEEEGTTRITKESSLNDNKNVQKASISMSNIEDID